MFAFGIVVYVMLLNLLIAVYSNEYDRVARESENIFVRERAKAWRTGLWPCSMLEVWGFDSRNKSH